MKQLFHIAYYKILIFLKLNKIRNLYDFLKSSGTSIVYFLFAAGAYYFTKSAMDYLLLQVKIGSFLLHEFASMILFIFFLAVNVGNIIVCYSTLYKSAEVNFLLSKPIHPSKLFIIKFLDNFFYSSSTLLVVLFAVIAGYASYYNLDFWTMAGVIIFNFMPFMFTAASLGVIVLLLIIKLASRYGFRPVIYALVLFYLTWLFLFFNTISPVTLVNEVFKYYPKIDRHFGELIPSFIKYLPNNWLSESLYWITAKQFNKALPYFIYQLILSVSLFITAVYLGNKWYYKTWLLMPGLGSKKSKKIQLPNPISFEKKSVLKLPVESIIKKDLLLFLREPAQVIHFLLLVMMIILFMVSVSGLTYIAGSNTYLKTLIFLSIFIFNVLLISTLALRFVYPLISLEGQAFWKIKTSPLENRKFIRIKLFIFSTTILFMSQVLSIFSNRKYPIDVVLFSCIIIFFISAALISINFGMGSIFANYNEKNPIRISSSQGASLSFLISIFYMIFLISVLFLPMNKYFENQPEFGNSGLLYFINPLLAIGIISTITIILFHLLALKALKKDF